MVCLKERICLLKSCFFSALFIFCLIFSLSYCSNPSGGDGGKPGLTGTVTISNTGPEVGDTLTASYEPGNGSGEATWQWLADGKPIEGANSTTHIVADSGLGKTLAARVSFADQSGSISSAATTPVAKTLYSIAEIREFLETHTGTEDNPLRLKLSIDLGQPSAEGSGWKQLLTALDEAKKYVALDLIACTMEGNVFDHDNNPAVSGTDRIVAISLPDAVTKVGYYVFANCTALTEVSIPEATSIGQAAFRNCTSLTKVSFPKVISIDFTAFYDCTSLTEVSFAKVTNIDLYAFNNCISLTEVSFPEAMSIGQDAFYRCTSLKEVSFPEATSIGISAFVGCTSLRTITFGTKAPIVGYSIFYGVSGNPTVTVKIPAGATGYGAPGLYDDPDPDTPNWANGFRGKGWDGTGFIGPTYGTPVTLVIEEY